MNKDINNMLERREMKVPLIDMMKEEEKLEMNKVHIKEQLVLLKKN